MKPQFVTFTGMDDATDLGRVVELSQRFPIEWGILSGSRAGVPRFPAALRVRDILKLPIRRSLHLCGPRARGFYDKSASVSFDGFERVQLNRPDYDLDWIEMIAKECPAPLIIQWRAREFPSEKAWPHLRYLFDQSGGRGVRAGGAWPDLPTTERAVFGFAGGLTPENVAEAVAGVVGAGPFWIDMETGVRTDEVFDLAKCEAVCRALWP